MNQFEHELRKRIEEELATLRAELEEGLAVKDYADYKKYTGKIASLKRVLFDFIDEVNEKLNDER